jgi:hypothetical protein
VLLQVFPAVNVRAQRCAVICAQAECGVCGQQRQQRKGDEASEGAALAAFHELGYPVRGGARGEFWPHAMPFAGHRPAGCLQARLGLPQASSSDTQAG